VYNKTVTKSNEPKGWSTESTKQYNGLFGAVWKDCKTNKSFMKSQSLAERNAKSTTATQAQNRQHLQPQARIELLDTSEEDDSINKAASVELGN
jgi:hypothetical protein